MTAGEPGVDGLLLGDPLGVRLGGNVRRIAGQIEREGEDRHGGEGGDEQEARIAVQRPVGKAVGGEQAAFDLQFRGTVLLGGDAAVAEVARQFFELRAVERQRRLTPVAGGRAFWSAG